MEIFRKQEPLVRERPDEVSLPKGLEEVVTPVETQVKAEVRHGGQNLMDTGSLPLDIKISEPQSVLEKEARGSPEEAKTWLSAFKVKVLKTLKGKKSVPETI